MSATLLNGIAPPSNSFVLRQHKIVYIATTKAASSSLRWLIADLAGENLDRFYRASGAHQSRYMTIHSNRARWQFATPLPDVDQDEMSEISPENGWFVFAVVRDPWTRMWSAWQSKFLVQHTPYLRAYRDEPWFPREPSSPGDIVDDWSAFVTARPWETHHELKTDKHFKTQVSSVRPGSINYSKIYDLRELPALQADLHAHLRTVGLDKELYLPRANENAIPMAGNVLDNGIDDIIGASYAVDLAEWGDRWDLETIKLSQGPIGMDSVRSVRYQIESNARIGDLSKELKRAQQRIAALEAGAAPASGPDGRPPGFAELLRRYPWPSKARYPDIEPVGRRTRGFDLIAETISGRGVEHPVVLEIGAELGGSTRRALQLPNAHVVSIDPWKDGHAFRAWPDLAGFKGVAGAPFDLFTSFNFEYRERLVAVREQSPRGVIVAYKAGLRPDVVYIDGDRRTQAVLRDLAVAAALFPGATLCGSDWTWQPQRNTEKYGGITHPVRAAVLQWAAFRNHHVETRQNTWLIDPSRKFNLRKQAAKQGS